MFHSIMARQIGRGAADPALCQTVPAADSAGVDAAVLRTVIDYFPGGLQLFDGNLKLVWCNERQKQLHDYPPNLFDFGQPGLEQILRFNAVRGEYGPGDIEAIVAEKMERARRGEAHAYERRRPNGTIIEVQGMPIPGGGYVVASLDVTRLRRGEAAPPPAVVPASPAAQSRAVFDDRFQRILARAGRGHVSAIHYVDLDNFKPVQARFGHSFGERLIASVAARLRQMVRETETIVRLGEDEFVILQADVDRPSSVARLAARLVEGVRLPHHVDGHDVSIGASIGIALTPRDGLDGDQLIARARDALYRARKETPEATLIRGIDRADHGVNES